MLPGTLVQVAMKKAEKFPAQVGAAVDLLYERRAARLALERQAEEMKEAEGRLKAHVLELLAKGKQTGAKGKVATAAVTWKRTLIVTDWSKFWAWARQDPLGVYVQRRAAVEATQEWMEQMRKPVPGVDPYDKQDLSLTKVGGST